MYNSTKSLLRADYHSILIIESKNPKFWQICDLASLNHAPPLCIYIYLLFGQAPDADRNWVEPGMCIAGTSRDVEASNHYNEYRIDHQRTQADVAAAALLCMYVTASSTVGGTEGES